MKTRLSIVFSALATTVLLAQDGKPTPGTATEASAKAVPATAPLVGVVDLVKAIELYPKWIKFQGEMKETFETFQGELATMSKQLNELKAKLDYITDADERRATEFRCKELFDQSQSWKKFQENRLELRNARATLAVYEDLQIAIDKVAKARGVSIVLRIHNMGPSAGNPAKLSDKTLGSRLDAFERREVLFAADNVDLTDDLIKLLQVPLDEPKEPAKEVGKDKDAAKPDAGKAPEAPKKTGG